MKYTLDFAKVGAVVFGASEFLEQVSGLPIFETDPVLMAAEAFGGIFLGGAFGMAKDVYEVLMPQKEIKPLARKVWQKGKPVFGYDRKVWRRTKYGRLIKYSDYGNRRSKYGWEIEHSKPKAAGGSDRLSNLLPEQWYENVAKGSKYPYRK